jgi:hypothetical protein
VKRGVSKFIEQIGVGPLEADEQGRAKHRFGWKTWDTNERMGSKLVHREKGEKTAERL